MDSQYKLKPDKHLTIDLMYSKDCFYTRSNKLFDTILKKKTPYVENSVYRCYYDPVNSIWEPRDIRPEKRYANNDSIIDSLVSYFKNPYDISILNTYINKTYYYQIDNRCYDNTNYFKKNYHILNKTLCNYKDSQTVLDLGCGYKSHRYLKKFKYSYYLGIDNDYKIISYNKNTYKDDVRLNYTLLDMSFDWNSQIALFNRTLTHDTPYDLILSINSIHNCYMNINNVIDNLNTLVRSKSKIIIQYLDLIKLKQVFSLKKMNRLSTHYNSDYVALIDTNKIKYYYSRYHTEPVTEWVFTKTELVAAFTNKNWKLIEYDESAYDISTKVGYNEWEAYYSCFSVAVLEFQ